ncbi:MAG: SPOR domain-containing protein [Spirochaetaceae bacterium]|nr:SPOR domain-containing protein [Spirochaetaceae bacterium]
MNYNRKIFFAVFLFFISSSLITADVVWEGTAAMSRHGEFPVNGFFGASNSFRINTIVSVENVRNNSRVEVIIVDNLNNNNLFLLLSRDASEMLGIRQDEISPVKVQVVREVALPGSAARRGAAGPAPTILANVEEVENILADSSAMSMADTGTPAAATVPRRVVIIYDDEAISDVAEGIIDEEPVAPIAEERVVTGPLPIATRIIADEAETDALAVIRGDNVAENLDSGAVSAITDADNELLSAAEGAEAGGARVFFLRPTDPRPPVVDDDATALSGLVARDTPVPHEAPTAPGRRAVAAGYYVQLMAFKDFSNAEQVMHTINIGYPVIIYYNVRQSMYQIIAGPLRTDERGAALHRARNSGYRDAFITRR